MTWSALKYGSIYFVLVFSAGFVLGIFRVLVLEPRIGAGYAELAEIPIMLLVIFLSAKYVVSKLNNTKPVLPYLVTGLGALALLLIFELTLVLGLQGISIGQYLESRDQIAFSAYILSLVVFALMPLLIRAWKNHN